MAPAITVRETMIAVRRAEPVKVQVASAIATTGPRPGVARLIAAAARRAGSAAAGVRPVATMNAAGVRTGAAGAGTSAAPSSVAVPADPVVRAVDRSADTDRPGLALPLVSATTAVGGRTAGAARGPRALRAIAATIAAVVSRAAAGATIVDRAATAAGTTAATTGAATTGAATTDPATTDPGTTDPGTTVAATIDRPQDARAPTAVTVIRGGRIDRTVARSVTTAVDPAIGTAPTTAETEREPVRVTAGTTGATAAGRGRITARATPDPAVERAPRAAPPPTAVNTAMIEAPSGPTSAVPTTTAEVDTGRTIADTGGETAADRITARAIGSAGTARLTPAGTGRAHHADTTGTTGRGAAPWTATDRRDTAQPIGRRDTGRTTADPEARAAAPPPATAQAVTVGGSTAIGRAEIGTATSEAAGTAVRTRRTEPRRAEAGPETGTRPDGTTGSTVRRRIVPTIADPAVLTAARKGAMMRGALAAPPHRVVDPATAMTGSGVTRGASGGPPAPMTTVGRRTGIATGPRAPRSVARRSAGPVIRLRARIAAMPTRSGSRRRRSQTT
jgi:hypothetical protein